MAGERQKVVDFVAAQMKKKPDITMTELKKLAGPKGLNVYPLIIGLARKKLGIKSTKKKASKKRAGKKRATRRRGVATIDGDLSSQLSGILDRMRALEEENDHLRDTLARIGQLASDA